jgi:hypothetical protein
MRKNILLERSLTETGVFVIQASGLKIGLFTPRLPLANVVAALPLRIFDGVHLNSGRARARGCQSHVRLQSV